MKRQRKCLCCNDAIPLDKRADSKFCSNTCKAKHWEESKGKEPLEKNPRPTEQKKESPDLQEGLRGIIKHNQQPVLSGVKTDGTAVKQPSVSSVQVETETYKTAVIKKQEAQTYIKRVLATIQKCDEQINNLEKNNQHFVSKINSPSKYIACNADADLAKDFYEDAYFEKILEKQKAEKEETEKHKKISYLKKLKSELDKHLNQANKQLKEAEDNLGKISQYETKQIETDTSLSEIVERIKLKKIQQQEVPNEVQTVFNSNIQTNGKIISSKQLKEMNYQCFNFKGRWQEFFGHPATVFHLAVHGKPGEGKSTFCIQFANYLADSHGNTIYISGEEGFSKTLQQKIIMVKAYSPHLFFADLRNYDAIKEEIENKFNFIFIDSLDTLKIDSSRLKELKELYPNSAFITISQSTKDGKMRGSQEIVHDADIAVRVENGIAVTTKNRFKEKGMEFGVFPNLKNKELEKITSLPKTRNII